MNSSCAPLGPRRRNSLMIRLPAASARGTLTTSSMTTVGSATTGIRTNMCSRSFAISVDPCPACVGEREDAIDGGGSRQGGAARVVRFVVHPSVIAIVPARFQSSRLPGKALADIAGRPMVEHVYRRAAAARSIARVIVATDDRRILDAVESFGGDPRLTSPSHQNGTHRPAQGAAPLDCDV